jgi:hypothetical protein
MSEENAHAGKRPTVKTQSSAWPDPRWPASTLAMSVSMACGQSLRVMVALEGTLVQRVAGARRCCCHGCRDGENRIIPTNAPAHPGKPGASTSAWGGVRTRCQLKFRSTSCSLKRTVDRLARWRSSTVSKNTSVWPDSVRSTCWRVGVLVMTSSIGSVKPMPRAAC